MRRITLLTSLTLLWCVRPTIAAAQNALSAPHSNPEAQRCAALTELNLENAPGGPAFITSVRLMDVPAIGLERPIYSPSGYGATTGPIATNIRQYCEVTGYVAPQNKFELKLPLPGDWNQSLFFAACGGFCGAADGSRCNLALARGYASVTGNGGHESSGIGFDAVWAANAPNLQEDFGWRSNHVVTLIAKAITTHYYGKPIKHSYMAGNSKGGQAVLLEAQRFPSDFDGLMPSAPVYDYTGRSVIAAAWFAQAISDGHGGSVLNAAAAAAVHKSVLEHCGAQAGVEEGLVTDPLYCGWQPEMIACTSESDASGNCLNARQVAAVKRLMAPVTNSKGEVLYAYPYLPGTETQWIGWNFFGAPGSGLRPRVANLYLPEQYLRYLTDEKIRDNADPLKFDFDRDPPTLARARRIYDATSFDLRAFKARGGKMLLWHGWADAGIMATSSIGYYEGVMKFMSGGKQTEDFFRLFLVPGVHHGGGGPGFTEFDAFTALENWVEKGEAPEKLIACRSSNGVVERCQPVFRYPILARYSDKGDPKQAESFVPFDPPVQSVRSANQSPRPAQPLILQEGDGEHLLRRYAELTLAGAQGSIPEFIIKIDKQNGGAEDFVVVTENLKPGAIIPFHLHHNAEEMLVLEEGGTTVTVGNLRALAGPRSIVFIPREAWISVTNTADHPIHLYALFSRPGFEDYLRARSVHPGEPITPLTSEERHKAEEQGHAMFWDVSRGPHPPDVAQSTQPSGGMITQGSASEYPLILQETDGERRVGRPAASGASPGQFSDRTKPFSFTIKVDGQNGYVQDFLVMTNLMKPGDVISFHQHHNAEEVIILEEGGATVTVGKKRAVAGPRSIVFIPRGEWVSFTNTTTHAIHVYGFFSRQEFERYYRPSSVPEGELVTPLSAHELARLRTSAHATYWDTSKGPYPPGVARP